MGSDTSGNVNVYPSGGQTGQVLTKTGEGRHALAWLDPHSSGHYVKDQSGQTMTQRRVIQFKNAAVSDDPSDEWTIVDCHGEKGDPGEDGKDAYTYAVEGGYPGTEEDFTEDLANIGTYAEDAQEAAEDAENAVEEIRNILDIPTFYVDFTTGNLIFNNDLKYLFSINQSTGNLEWEVI